MAILVIITCFIFIQSIGCMKNSTGYLLTLPRILQAGAKERFCIVLHGSMDITPYTLTLTHQDTAISEELTLWTDEGGCKELAIPQKVGKYDIALVETNTDTKLKEMEVEVQGQNLITFIQTDKPIYKPGQTVHFRILTMRRDLKPRIGKISEVFVKDPNDVRVKQWLDIESDGLSSLEFQLAAEPKLGVWTIEVTVDDEPTTQTFKVDEYVLPKFEVTIVPPKYILANASVVEGEICARYTYGKPVKGHLSAKICLGGYRSLTAPCADVIEEIDGCYQFSVNASEVGFQQGYYLYRSELKISAEVRERDTGSLVTESHKGPSISFDPLKITLEDDTNKYFKPSFPYRGRAVITKPNGEAAPGEMIEITMINYKNDIRLSRNFTSDDNGIIQFSTCDPIAPNTADFRIEARAVSYVEDDSGPPSYRLYMPRAFSTIKQWFSPSRSYIQIPQINNTKQCGEEITLDIPYTTTLDSYTLFHFQVMSRGRILHSGHKEHHFLKHDKTYMLDVSAEKCLINEVISPPPVPENFNDAVKPTVPPILEDIKLEEQPTHPPPPPPETMEMKEGMNPPEGKKKVEKQREVVEEEIIPEVFQPLAFEPLNSAIRRKRSIMPYHSGNSEDIPVVLSENPSTHVSHVKITFVVNPDMSPKASLLVYYIRDDGETVADSIQFKVESCFRNKVSMEFSEKEVLPGAETMVTLEATPGSLCSLGIVDKSINILGGDHQLTPEKVFEKLDTFSLSQYGYHYFSDQEYCEKKFKGEGDEKMAESPEIYPSWHHYSSNYVDAVQAFKSMGLLVMTNLILETRPCSKSYPIYYDGGPIGAMGPMKTAIAFNSPVAKATVPLVMAENVRVPAPSSTQAVNLRTLFPETWLWQLERVGDDGQLITMHSAPHTVTKWLGSTVCTHSEDGFGFSPVVSLTTFQPFFLSFSLPYSAIRGERLPIRITTFNYLDKCLLMQMNIDVWEDIEVVHGSLHNLPFCICGGESHTKKYYIIPHDIGELPITASAEIVPGSCDNSVEMNLEYIGMRDAAQRNILVKAEGVLQEYSISKYICPNGKEIMEDFDLPVPDDTVYDSARGHISVIGDIMGPALSNLDNLVSQPTGCGEQTMVTFTPNIYVLKYLKSVDQNTEELEALAKHYMEIGYQRELTFRHNDGSFSAFGESDPSGSTWLTAFVIQSFAQAQDYIYIDKTDLEKSIQFLRSTRLENGCFREVGKVFSSYMMGGLGKTKDVSDVTAITAYVILSLLEANVSKDDTLLKEGIDCLNRQDDSDDTYTRAVVAYANVMFDPRSNKSIEAMDNLYERVIKDGNLQHWGRTSAKPKPVNSWYHFSAPSAEVEMTAYGMLAKLAFADDIVDVVPVAMWMSQQQNAFGGYASTQDTVVGLHALSEFASWLQQTNGDDDESAEDGLTVVLEGNNLDKAFTVTPENSLLLQKTQLKQVPNLVQVTSKGKGCALVQANVRYNKVPDTLGIDEPLFDLSVKTTRKQNDCAIKTMSICVSFANQDGYSNGMSLITVGMVTSWSPIAKSLRQLRSMFSILNMKKYEINNKDGTINFYFDELDQRSRCFNFDMEQDKDLAVSDPKPANVQVFQYYEKEVTAIKAYKLKTICGTKEEIPINPPIDEPINPFEQRRVQTRGSAQPVQQRELSEVVKCPTCMNKVPDNLQELICRSGSVLKVSAGRNGKVSMKLKSDLKPRRKQRIDKFVSVQMNEACKCSLINPPKKSKRAKRILIFTDTPTLIKKEGQKEKAIILTSSSHLINLDLNKSLERRVRIMSKKCRSP